jgi:hypothetical protein
MLRSVLVLGVLGLSGCGDGPAGPQSAPPPASEPRLQMIPFFFTCKTFHPQVDMDALVLADVYHGTGVEAAVQKAGGRVVHRFQLPVLRVEIRASSIPLLPYISHARGVTDAGKQEIKEVMIDYSRAATESDLQQLRTLGASEIKRPQFLETTVLATLPDASIPSVRRLDGVTRLELNHYTCLDDVFGGS